MKTVARPDVVPCRAWRETDLECVNRSGTDVIDGGQAFRVLNVRIRWIGDHEGQDADVVDAVVETAAHGPELDIDRLGAGGSGDLNIVPEEV